jgi:hypothetical protein
VHAQAPIADVTAQPAILASFVTLLRDDEQVATAARKVGRVERRFEFIDHVADGFLRDPVALIKQLVGRRSGPARAIGEILFGQLPIGVAELPFSSQLAKPEISFPDSGR